MTAPAPLVLPETDGFPAWLDERCASALNRVYALAQAFRDLGNAPASQVLAAWNDVAVELGNALSVASLMTNVHPDEQVRGAAETAEQEARRLLTELSLDRALFDVLASVDA